MSESRSNASVDQAVLDTINRLIDEGGLAKAELARRAGMKRGKLNRILGGQVMSFDDLWAIARGLGVSPVALLPIELGPAPSELELRLIRAVRNADTDAAVMALGELGLALRRQGGAAGGEGERLTRAAEEIRRSADKLQSTLEGAGATAAGALRAAADALVAGQVQAVQTPPRQ